MFLFKRIFLILLVVAGFAMLASPPPASAQSTELLLEDPVCRENPHSEDCICAQVRKFGFFPKSFDLEIVGPDGKPTAKDVDEDGFAPVPVEGGLWEDKDGEALNYDATLSPDTKANLAKKSDLLFMVDDRYNQRCAMSYFRENQRRLWVFAVWLGAGFTVISLIWGGVAYMQNAASGVELSRIRGMLTRVLVGFVILACALLIWDGVSGALFYGVDSWTQDRGVYYDLR